MQLHLPVAVPILPPLLLLPPEEDEKAPLLLPPLLLLLLKELPLLPTLPPAKGGRQVRTAAVAAPEGESWSVLSKPLGYLR